jgi:hypothetical protein
LSSSETGFIAVTPSKKFSFDRRVHAPHSVK